MSLFDAPPPAFDLDTVNRRISDTARALIKAMVITGEAERIESDEAAQRRFNDQLVHLVTDAVAATGELRRLYGRFEELQRRHAPFAGEPGAPAMCTACSLRGEQVPWPCEVYNFAAKSLPERR